MPGEADSGVLEYLLTPADDDGIGELVIGAEDGKRLVALCGEGDLDFELGRKHTGHSHAGGFGDKKRNLFPTLECAQFLGFTTLCRAAIVRER
jgi:hypothetical protein